MISENQVITIEGATLVGRYSLELSFNDGLSRVVDFEPFLSASLNPLIRKYLDSEEFGTFSIVDGDLQWNDYDLCFPVADLYEGNISG